MGKALSCKLSYMRTCPVMFQVMEDFYNKINDPSLNGAIFIAVCRGKVISVPDQYGTMG